MLNEALADHVTQLGDQALVHEHAIKLALLGIDQKSSHRLVQVVEYLLEVSGRLGKGIFGADQVKDLEKAVDVAI